LDLVKWNKIPRDHNKQCWGQGFWSSVYFFPFKSRLSWIRDAGSSETIFLFQNVSTSAVHGPFPRDPFHDDTIFSPLVPSVDTRQYSLSVPTVVIPDIHSQCGVRWLWLFSRLTWRDYISAHLGRSLTFFDRPISLAMFPNRAAIY